MGIGGLLAFTEDVSKAWSPIRLTNTKLIVDGNNLYPFLASKTTFDPRCGGEYPDFYRMVRSFFASLLRDAVTPLVLLDGVDNGDEKLATTQRRHKERMAEANKLVHLRKRPLPEEGDTFLPLLVHEIFFKAVTDSGVDLIVCDHEADIFAIARARHDRCPLLSRDSDFLLANLPAGVVHVNTLDDQGQVIDFKGFRRDKFFTSVGLNPHLDHPHLDPQYDFGPLLAVLLKNDLTDLNLLTPIYQRFKVDRAQRKLKISGIIKQLKKFPNVVDAEKGIFGSSAQLQACLKATKDFYYGSAELNETVSNRKGCFSYLALQAASLRRVFLMPQVEKVDSPCSHNASLHVRRAVYDIAVPRPDGCAVTIDEHRRRDNGSDPVVVSIEVPPPLSCIPSLDPNERRAHLIRCIVGEWDCDIDHIKPEEFVLPMVTLFCWAYQCEEQPSENAIRALLLCFTNCHASLRAWEPNQKFAKGRERRRGLANFDSGLATAIARWQSIFSFSLELNAVLHLPLPQVNPAYFFDGFLLQKMYAECHQHQEFLSNCEQRDVFEKLWTFLMENKPVRTESKAKSKRRSKASKPKKNKKPKTTASLQGSRFRLLEIETI